jgi:hypothetical protein
MQNRPFYHTIEAYDLVELGFISETEFETNPIDWEARISFEVDSDMNPATEHTPSPQYDYTIDIIEIEMNGKRYRINDLTADQQQYFYNAVDEHIESLRSGDIEPYFEEND